MATVVARLSYGSAHENASSRGLASKIAAGWYRSVDVALGDVTDDVDVSVWLAPGVTTLVARCDDSLVVPVGAVVVDALAAIDFDTEPIPDGEPPLPVLWRQAFDVVPPWPEETDVDDDVLATAVVRLAVRGAVDVTVRTDDGPAPDLAEWLHRRLPPGPAPDRPNDPGCRVGVSTGEGPVFVVGGPLPEGPSPDTVHAATALIAAELSLAVGRRLGRCVDPDPVAPRWWVFGSAASGRRTDSLRLALEMIGKDGPTSEAVGGVDRLPPPLPSPSDPFPVETATIVDDTVDVARITVARHSILFQPRFPAGTDSTTDTNRR